ncbi:MAG: PEP-CTERM sorting domain-containing protein [Pseudomonadota bacterium]
MQNTAKTLAIASLCSLASTLSYAIPSDYDGLWHASDTSVNNSGCKPNGTHGFWSGSFSTEGSCSNYYSINDGSTLLIDSMNDLAVFEGTATNIGGITATIAITFDNYSDSPNPLTRETKEVGGSYDPNTDTPNWDFFQAILSGSIMFSDGYGDFEVLLVGQNTASVPSADKPVLQVGVGANDKDGAFGASTWLHAFDSNGNKQSGHWDLNLDLEFKSDDSSTVPAPGTLALFGIALLGLFGARRVKGTK